MARARRKRAPLLSRTIDTGCAVDTAAHGRATQPYSAGCTMRLCAESPSDRSDALLRGEASNAGDETLALVQQTYYAADPSALSASSRASAAT